MFNVAAAVALRIQHLRRLSYTSVEKYIIAEALRLTTRVSSKVKREGLF